MGWRAMLESDGAPISVAPKTKRAAPAIVNAVVAATRARRTPRSNRALTPSETSASDELWFTWRGSRIGYTRRGTGALPVLLVHGIHLGASSREWRQVVDSLAAEHTVYAIDLLGFGRSDRPTIDYSSRTLGTLIADFVTHVIGEPTVLVAAERAAAYAIDLGARDPGRFPAIIAVGPTGLAPTDEDDETRIASRSAARTMIGSLAYRMRVSHERIQRWLERAYADRDLVTDALVAAYHAEAHRTGARFVAAALARGELDLDVRAAMRRLTQPMLLVWGARASIVPADGSLGFRALKPDAELALIDLAGDLPHDERPAEFLRAALAFLAEARRDHERRKPKPVVSLQTA